MDQLEMNSSGEDSARDSNGAATPESASLDLYHEQGRDQAQEATVLTEQVRAKQVPEEKIPEEKVLEEKDQVEPSSASEAASKKPSSSDTDEDPEGESLETASTAQKSETESSKEAGSKKRGKNSWVSFKDLAHQHRSSSPLAKADAFLSYMRLCLSQQPQPRFVDFWACRRDVASLFDHIESVSQKEAMLQSFNELLLEARGLKLLIDEQQRLCIEKIEREIASLEQILFPEGACTPGESQEKEEERGSVEPIAQREGFQREDSQQLEESSKEVSSQEVTSQEVTPLVPSDPLALPASFEEKIAPWNREKWPELFASSQHYNKLQGLLNWACKHATSLQSLRKELMQLSMRLGAKNRLLSRLSRLGDQIFPIKKEGVLALSQQFARDLEQFERDYFKLEEQLPSTPLFRLRAQIKELQALAKELTINTHAFKSSREILGRCWEQLKKYDKLLAKSREAKQTKVTAILEREQRELENLTRQYESGSMAQELYLRRLKELEQSARHLALPKAQLASISKAIAEKRDPILEEQRKAFQEQKRQREEQARQRASRASHFESRLIELYPGLAAEEVETTTLTEEELPDEKEELQSLSGCVNTLKALHELTTQWNQSCKMHNLLPSERAGLDLSLDRARLELLDRLGSMVNVEELSAACSDDFARHEFFNLVSQIALELEETFKRRLHAAGLDFHLALELQEKLSILDHATERLEDLREEMA